jgi:hypothetical protein
VNNLGLLGVQAPLFLSLLAQAQEFNQQSSLEGACLAMMTSRGAMQGAGGEFASKQEGGYGRSASQGGWEQAPSNAGGRSAPPPSSQSDSWKQNPQRTASQQPPYRPVTCLTQLAGIAGS